MTKLRRPYFKTPVMPKNMACLLWSEGKSKKFQLQLTHIQNSFPSATFHWRMGGHAHHSHDGGGEIFAEYRTKIAKRIFRVENLSTVGGGAWGNQTLDGSSRLGVHAPPWRSPPTATLTKLNIFRHFSTFLDISRHFSTFLDTSQTLGKCRSRPIEPNWTQFLLFWKDSVSFSS